MLGSTLIAPQRFNSSRWVHWEASAGVLVLSELWIDNKDLVDNAICLKVGDTSSGDVMAVTVSDVSSADVSGPLCILVSILFEDGSIIMLKIKAKDSCHSLMRDLVQFKEGMYNGKVAML
jgi:hypothetical protein